MTLTVLHISGVRFIVHARFACDSRHRSAAVMGADGCNGRPKNSRMATAPSRPDHPGLNLDTGSAARRPIASSPAGLYLPQGDLHREQCALMMTVPDRITPGLQGPSAAASCPLHAMNRQQSSSASQRVAW